MKASTAKLTDLPQALGEIVLLCAEARPYRRWSISDCERFFLPPLRLGQHRLYVERERVVGLVTWAWIDEACKARLIHEGLDLFPDDWVVGKHLYFAEFVAPFGHARMIIDDLTDGVFPRERAFSVRRRPDNSVYKVCHWVGRELRAKEA